MRWRSSVRRTVGTASGSALALALLVGCCVFAALAGPALSLHTRTQALHQTLAGYPNTTKTVQVTASWATFSGSLQPIRPGQNLDNALPQALNDVGSGLRATPLPLAGGDWASLTAKPIRVAAGAAARAQAGAPPQLQVSYRTSFTGFAQLVAGTFSGGRVPPGAVGVAATTQTAARFGMHPGSRLTLAAPSGPVLLFVTAIVRPRQAGSTFWRQDATPVKPALEQVNPDSPLFWAGGVIADPDQFGAFQGAFGGTGLALQLEFPVNAGGMNADQVHGLYNALNRAAAVTPTLTGALAPAAETLTVSSPLLPDLALFRGTQAAVETVLLLLFTSLVVVGAAVILLAGRMLVARRQGELALLRARGGSLGQVAGLTLRGAVAAAGPGVLLGAGLAIAVVPGAVVPGGASAGWPLAGIAIAAALAGPPVIAVWQHRRPAPPANPALITTAETRPTGAARRWRRPVAEVTAIAASVAGLVVLHDQGVPAGGSGSGIEEYLAIVPVLVAVPVVVIMLRLYPLIIRGLLALSARRTGATGFVALSRAARSTLTGALPAFALVLTLSLATFAGMVSQGIARGEITASWHATGADVMIQTGPGSGPVTPAAVTAIGAVRGVRHATEVWNTSWFTSFGQPISVSAVDPAGYAAVVAGTPFPPFPAGRIGAAAPGRVLPPGAVVPVLASPSAAAILGTRPVQLDTLSATAPLTVRVAGTVTETPAQLAGDPFVIMPLLRLPGPAGVPAPNLLLATGTAIDHTRLTAVADRVIPGSVTAFRTGALASLASSPLQHGAALLITLTIATAAALGLFVVILALALGSADRGITVARLTVMGHERAAGLVMAEVMPAVLTAIAAGVACAIALPLVIGSAIDLSAFTGTSIPVRLQPDPLALGLPAVIIGVLALAALAAEARSLSRRDVAGVLRAH
jgi:putative ABC transport system permease protein